MCHAFNASQRKSSSDDGERRKKTMTRVPTYSTARKKTAMTTFLKVIRKHASTKKDESHFVSAKTLLKSLCPKPLWEHYLCSSSPTSRESLTLYTPNDTTFSSEQKPIISWSLKYCISVEPRVASIKNTKFRARSD